MPNPPGSARHHTTAIPHIHHLQLTMYTMCVCVCVYISQRAEVVKATDRRAFTKCYKTLKELNP